MGIKTLSLAKLFCLLILGVYAAGCAGPTTPFGAVSLKRALTAPPKDGDDDGDDDNMVAQNQIVPPVQAPAPVTVTAAAAPAPMINAVSSRAPAPSTSPQTSIAPYLRPKISFYPKRQILHGKTPFTIVVSDPEGIPTNYELTVLYNGIDVTRRFLWQAEENFYGHPATELRLTMNNLRMLPGRYNKVEVVYWHAHNDRPAYARFEPPQCSAFQPMRIATTGDFEVPSRLLDDLTRQSLARQFNPSFVAGLIAQESAFNSKAVSSAKAIGLTQITPLGEAEVIKSYGGWPRYPNVNRLPSPIVRVQVMRGKINGNNEWRLNPDLSVEGGLTYLQFLDEYWRKPSNYGLVAAQYKDPSAEITRLILASYNSGPARVSSALMAHGRRWLIDDSDLKEARKYVARVLSYCDYFSQQEDEENASTPKGP